MSGRAVAKPTGKKFGQKMQSFSAFSFAPHYSDIWLASSEASAWSLNWQSLWNVSKRRRTYCVRPAEMHFSWRLKVGRVRAKKEETDAIYRPTWPWRWPREFLNADTMLGVSSGWSWKSTARSDETVQLQLLFHLKIKWKYKEYRHKSRCWT